MGEGGLGIAPPTFGPTGVCLLAKGCPNGLPNVLGGTTVFCLCAGAFAARKVLRVNCSWPTRAAAKYSVPLA